MAGRREIAEIARLATTLSQAQGRRLGLPLKKGTRAFRKVPGYDVFYQVLTRMDPEAFAAHLNRWLLARAGSLPQALALDGKMIRDAIGVLTLAQHEDGAPQAQAVYDQKEGTPRCEQTAAAQLVDSLPALDGKLITADPLHCQRSLEWVRQQTMLINHYGLDVMDPQARTFLLRNLQAFQFQAGAAEDVDVSRKGTINW